MFHLSRLLELAGQIIWRLSSTESRRLLNLLQKPLRPLGVEELESRVVPSLMGQQLFPSDNPWNQNISAAPVAANSAAVIAHIGTSTRLTPDWYSDNPANGSNPLYGIPFNIVHGNSLANVNVTIDNYPGESNITPVPIPANAVIEGDYQNGPNPKGGGYNSGQRGDSHLIVWDEDTNIAYELYGVTRPSDTKLFPNTNGVELPHTDGLWHAAQETVWNMNTNTFRTLGDTSADAAGLSILAGLARPDEGLPVSQGGQGVINHALRVTLPGGEVNPQYTYPASHMVSESQGANKLPLGSRLRLQSTPAINTLIANMPPESQIVARAMQQYGLIVADIGSAMYVSGASASVDSVDSPNTNLVWNVNDIFASNGLEALNAGDFAVVNLQPQVTGLSATSGPAGTTVTVIGQNFSGAAGNLSVFFGTTAAAGVTLVDDSHLTVVVPNGSGTVNVTVRSGIQETDSVSDNPAANVNNPIFGYGTSAVSTADQFTYSGAPLSGSNSTDSLATSTITAGLTDTLTIVVKDTTSSAVTGLPNVAFGFSLSGGSSAGTFGTVTETATKGTYTVAFTGTTAGTASTLTTTVAGVTLTTQPAVTVTSVPGSPPPPTNTPPPTNNPPPTNTPPPSSSMPINAIGPQTVAGGSTLTFTVTANNPGSAPLPFSLAAGAPVGAGINAQTGLFTWMPSELKRHCPRCLRHHRPSCRWCSHHLRDIRRHRRSKQLGRWLRPRGTWPRRQRPDAKPRVLRQHHNRRVQPVLGPAPRTRRDWRTGLPRCRAGCLTSSWKQVSLVRQSSSPTTGAAAPRGCRVSTKVSWAATPSRRRSSTGSTSWPRGWRRSRWRWDSPPARSAQAQCVQADYQQFLGRAANSTEVSYWVSEFLSGASNEQVNAGFLSSPEYFQQHGGNVVDWLFAAYRAVLNRQPDTVGYQYWLGQLG